MMYEVPADIEQLINQQMAIGNYISPDELLRDALQELARRRNVNGQDSVVSSACTALEALQQHGLVGSVKSGQGDLSVNSAHMEGFGRNGS